MDGKRFVIVERDGREVREALGRFAEVVDAWTAGPNVSIITLNGGEYVRVEGSPRIIFTTPRSRRLRGRTADVVFIDNDADRVLADAGAHLGELASFRADLAAALASGGEVVRS